MRKTWIVLLALVFSFILQTIREWTARDRSLVETFSSWEWALNFLIYWLLSFIVITIVFVGLDMLRERFAS